MLFQSAQRLARMIQERQVSAVEVLEAHLAQIRARNPELNAIVTLDESGARQRAQEADAALARGECWGELHGVPLTLKDSHSVAGMRTTAGWTRLADYIPTEDGSVAARLKAAGAIIMGKSNVPVLLGDYQSDNPIFGRTQNPWNLQRTPGGSSGGAAAALAAGMTPLEIGSDIGGSIRVPSHFCGVFGLKTTENHVSRHGQIPSPPGTPPTDRVMASVGPIARNMEDLALAYRIIAGADPAAPEIPPVPVERVAPPPLKKLRIAWTSAFPGNYVAKEIRAAIERVASALACAGATVEKTLPELDYELESTTFQSLLDFTFRTFIPLREGQQPLTAADYLTALYHRDHYIRTWERFLDDWDVLICPVASTTAFPHCPMGTPLTVDDRTVGYFETFASCWHFSLTGHPVLTMPVGLDGNGLPIGMQVVTKRWADARLLAIGESLAEVTGPFQRPSGY